jgi:hypothetical protein
MSTFSEVDKRFDEMWDSLKSVSGNMPDGSAYVDDLIVKSFLHQEIERAYKKGYGAGVKKMAKEWEKALKIKVEQTGLEAKHNDKGLEPIPHIRLKREVSKKI